MITVCLYFQAHQPFRIRELSFFEIGDKPELFDNPLNKKILAKVSRNSYQPCFGLFKNLVKSSKGKFRFALSATGILLEQLQKFQPGLIQEIGELLSSGSFELLGETYYHSFSSLYSVKEFQEQVTKHKELLNSLFHTDPIAFRNTELAFRSDIAKPLDQLGFRSILIEGSDRTLKGKSPNFLYNTSAVKGMNILTRNQEYSNYFTCKSLPPRKKRVLADIDTLIKKILDEEGDVINIWFDIECLGEHQKASTGIFGYFENFIQAALKTGKIKFMFPSEVASTYRPKGTIDVYSPVTWHAKSNDISAWNGNAMQIEAMKYIYGLEKKLKATKDGRILETWRRLQSSDHLLYMDTEEKEGARPSQLFSPFKSPHDAYIYLMNALASLDIETES